MYTIRPIKTEEDYAAALEHIEELWGAEAGTPEDDDLDVLLTLVEAYEDANHPVPPPTPIEAIKFVMDQNGFKQVDMVPYLGSRSKVSEVLSGKRPLTLSMIRALNKQLHIPAEVLIQDGRILPEDDAGVEWKRFPVNEIVKRGLVAGYDPKTQAEEIVRELVSLSGMADEYKKAANSRFRQGSRRNVKNDQYAVQAWLLQVAMEARRDMQEQTFDFEENNENLLSRIAQLSVFSDGPLKAKEYLTTRGITLVIVPHYKRTYIDGAVLLLENQKPVIGLTLRYDRLDNFWFTLLHELAHLVLGHVREHQDEYIIDDLDVRSALDEVESEADNVANEALIPTDLWESHDAKETGRLEDVIDLARKADVHRAIVAGRVRFAKNNYRILPRHVGQGEVRKLFAQ